MNIEQWKELLAKYGSKSTSTFSNGIEDRTNTSGWSLQDTLRPQETRWYSKSTGQPMGAGYASDLYQKSMPNIDRNEWNQHLQKAWGETPYTTQNIGGKTVATKTMDASGVQGYDKWGYGTDGGVNGKSLTQTYILPEGALDFKFAQSNAPLSDARRSNSYRFGGEYTNATVEASPTRFTNSDLNLGFANNRAVSGGLTDYTTGESFYPENENSAYKYDRFSGVQDSWNDEWAQSQGFKNYQDYLNRK
jgi:hypothetical protein